jgi:hypothetical protein
VSISAYKNIQRCGGAVAYATYRYAAQPHAGTMFYVLPSRIITSAAERTPSLKSGMPAAQAAGRSSARDATIVPDAAADDNMPG